MSMSYGDWLCAQAEREADEDAVLESIEDEAYRLVDEWLDCNDQHLILPNGRELAHTLWDDESWGDVADVLAISAMSLAGRTYGSPSIPGATWGRKKAEEILLPLAIETITKRRAEDEAARREAYEDHLIESARAEMGAYE